MRYLVFILSIVPVCGLFAQLTDEIREELEPSHYQTKILLTPLPGFVEMGGGNLVWGYGITADGFIGKRFSVGAGFTSSYNDNNYKSGNDPFHSDSYQGVDKAGSTFGHFAFHLMDRIAMGRIRFDKYKGREYSGGKTYDVYDVYKKRGPVRKIIALRGGIYNWHSGVVPDAEEWFVTNPATNQPVAVDDRTYTTLRTSNFSVGISFGKIVAGSDMGPAGMISYFRNLYVDALIGTSVKMDDNVNVNGVKSPYRIDEGDLKKSAIGWKLGWKYVGLARKYWVGGYYFECGVRPGIASKGPFLQMGLILGTKYPFKPITGN